MSPSDVVEMYKRAGDLAPVVKKPLDGLADGEPYSLHTSGFEFRTPTYDDNVEADETYVFVAHFAIEGHPAGAATTDVKIGLAFGDLAYERAVRRFLAVESAKAAAKRAGKGK